MINAQLIREIREARGWSQADLALRVGASQSTIDKIERGESVTSRYIVKIATVLSVPVEEIDSSFIQAMNEGTRRTSTLPMLNRDGRPGGYRPPEQLVSDEDPLPVYAAAEGGNGEMIIHTDPVEMSPRPYMLRGAREAYGILVTGESMTPAFRPGDIAWVDPRLPPMRESEAIFYFREGGDDRASIKELVRWTDRAWHVRQWNPSKEFDLPRDSWHTCHRVVGRLLRR